MFKIGDYVRFGNYFNTDNTCKKEVEWLILDQDEDAILVISKYVIDAHIFNNSWGQGITWENSEIRKWMNTDLYESLFNEQERKFVISRKITTSGNPKPLRMKSPSGTIVMCDTTTSGISGCGETFDKLFILSWEEGEKYFSNDACNSQKNMIYNNLMRIFSYCEIDDVIVAKKNLKTKLTNYARSRFDREIDGEDASFWFRSPGGTCHSFVVSFNGLITRLGSEQGDIIGVRPAMWLLKKGVTEQNTLDVHELSLVDYSNNCKTDWFVQAVQQAKSYMSRLSFSFSGLVEQLEYDGFTHEQAVYGAENCGADWFIQAVIQAKRYVSRLAFSYKGLIEQLEYDGFTHEQAIYGADNV